MQYVILLLGGLLLALFSTCAYLLKENAALKTLSEINNATLESQNKAIEQIILDSEAYHCDLEAMNDYTKAKYEKVIHEHENESCESKLKEFEKALNIYSGE